MSFVDHYQRKKAPEGSHAHKQGKRLVQKLIDSHLIGVQVNDDFTYDPLRGEGKSKKVETHWSNFFSHRLKSGGVAHISGVFDKGEETQPIGEPASSIEVSAALPVDAETESKIKANFDVLSDSEVMPVTGAVQAPFSPELNIAKIKNFAVAMPYGAAGQKIFFHGKELFSYRQARDIFERGVPVAEIQFSDTAIQKAAAFFRNESFDTRLVHYFLQGKPDMLGLVELGAAFTKEQYPDITLPPLPANEGGLLTYINAMVDAFTAVGVDMQTELQKSQKNLPSEAKDKLLKKINDEVPAKLEAYLADHQDIASRFGDQLRAYHQSHHNDFEILENFKSGLPKADATHTSLEDILEAGIRERAQTVLQEIAASVANPYSKQMEAIEKGMAETVVQSLPPKTINIILHDKTAAVFFDDNGLEKAASVMGTSLGFALGKFATGTPQSKHFSEFVLVSDQRLSKRNLPWLLRHEFEHKLDFKPDLEFAMKYRDRIPAMIAADKDRLMETIEFIAQLNDTSPKEDSDRLRLLGKKRGVRLRLKDAATENPHPNAITIEEAKAEFLTDLWNIKAKFSVFLPNGAPKPHEPAKPSSGVYAHDYSKMPEIPAVLEELKGKYGRAFIGEVMPKLSTATSEHRKSIYKEASLPTVR